MSRSTLRTHLDALVDSHDVAAGIGNDPIQFPRRYADPRDVEVSALLAASYAYGKVDLFIGVLERLFTQMDAAGGPRAYVDSFDPDAHGSQLMGLGYRWTRDTDLIWFLAALRAVLSTYGTLADVFAGSTAAEALQSGSERVLRAAIEVSATVGTPVSAIKDLPRGLRYFVPAPKGGSACKRGNLFLRWMVRPSTHGVDLGLWTHLTPADLIMPVDRHVRRISPLIGLVPKSDGSWRSAVAITRALAAFNADDPVRYDFALAHVGISSGCQGKRDVPVCSRCPLQPLCVVGRLNPTSEPS